MHAVTYGVARGSETDTAAIRQERGHKPLFARVMDALKETRYREARRIIARHAHLLPPGNP
ncbi:MAG TPA: hypothetical protein VFB29_12415 [Pseudolabrys sp.]|nr:hypothetical protein [Pseudolabrys sp.]